MNGWYKTKDNRHGEEMVINLDYVTTILNDNDCATFIMNTGRDTSYFNSVHSNEKYSDVIRKIFGPEEGEPEPEEGEDDGKPGDPSGFNNLLPM